MRLEVGRCSAVLCSCARGDTKVSTSRFEEVRSGFRETLASADTRRGGLLTRPRRILGLSFLEEPIPWLLVLLCSYATESRKLRSGVKNYLAMPLLATGGKDLIYEVLCNVDIICSGLYP